MEFKISEIDWNNEEEVNLGRFDNNGEEVFSVDYLKENKEKYLPHAYFAKNKNGKIIGKIIIAICDEDNEAFFVHPESKTNPRLFGVFVKEEYRNNGIGKKLIDNAIKYSKEKGFKYLFLDTDSASKYYEKNWNFKYYHTVKNRTNPKTNEVEYLNLYYLDLKNE